jgi:hypothetical protein
VKLIREDWDEAFDASSDYLEDPDVYRTAYYIEYEVVASGGKFSHGGLHRTETDALADADRLLPGLTWHR